MRSIDIVFDETTDAAVRAEWRTLADDGIPSLALHTGSSNRPHITLAAGSELELSASVDFEPFAIELGAAVLFPRKSGFLLARSVVPTRELLDLHRTVLACVTGETDTVHGWTPHVTLSRRIEPEQLTSALGAVGSPIRGRVLELRIWDSVTKTVTSLASIADEQPQ